MTEKPITDKELKSALPDTSKIFLLKGIDGPIEIYRDRFGVPHVLAKTVHDAFFGQGFVTAQDRLWHMDYDRRSAYGRLAEVLGASAVEEDKRMRRFQIGATVRDDYRSAHTAARAMLDAYAAGVNALIESTDALPVEYQLVDAKPEPWQPWDSFAVFKVRHILMGVFEGKLWRARLVKTLGVEKAAAPRHLGELASRLITLARTGDSTLLPPGATWRSVATEALNESVSYLRKRLGDDMGAWQWGSLHRTLPKHPLSAFFPGLEDLLNPPSVPMGGDGDTPLAGGYSPGRPFAVTLLSVVRYVFDLSDWDNSRWAVPLGVSGHPASPHYADQDAIWGALKLVPMSYTWDRVKEEAASHQILEPEM